jgi:hypothetical protein
MTKLKIDDLFIVTRTEVKRERERERVNNNIDVLMLSVWSCCSLQIDTYLLTENIYNHDK